ncbi:MAG: hypothetical protein ACRD1T_04025, partial [Acidimicrobiia bacterium]
QYDHVAVIVAEEITARFFNVIGLFNGSIPLIAIQLNAYEVSGALTLIATTVLDLQPLGLDEDDEGGAEIRDRNFWEAEAPTGMLQLIDSIHAMIRESEPDVLLNYTKNYVGLSRSGVASNYVLFKPRRSHVLAEFKIPKSEDLTHRLEESGITLLDYSSRWARYRIRIAPEDLVKHEELLRELIDDARKYYGG